MFGTFDAGTWSLLADTVVVAIVVVARDTTARLLPGARRVCRFSGSSSGIVVSPKIAVRGDGSVLYRPMRRSISATCWIGSLALAPVLPSFPLTASTNHWGC